ncbi:MAG: IS3 family transposase [Campylobacterales bacterium]|nr:IS3 family transposase [Campylobacterales bacterium]
MGLYITTVIMSIGFHYLETELVYHESFKTKAQANEMIFEYIEIFYNRQRLHSYNYYMSPVEFEEKMLHKERCLEYNFICLI